MKNISLIFLLLFIAKITFAQLAENAFPIGERHRIQSSFLNDERSFQIYLPPSYYFSKEGNYPVVYLLDGDYNFHYDTGLIELLSAVSGRIPEMIVVGISDNGAEKYRANCTPTNTSDQSGNANNFMSYIKKELQPFIDKNYRTSDYNMIIGHSIGGLFIANYLLERPQDFDSYVAIDPALWWDDYEIIQRADSLFKDQKELAANLFISLADNKYMGVRQFVGILDKHFPDNKNWNFKYYENENHGSVGLVTIKDALLTVFKDWEISREQFYTLESAQGVINHYKKLNDRFSASFTLPASSLGNIIYYYFNKEKKEDLEILEIGIKKHFPSFLDEFYMQLASNYMRKEQFEKAAAIYKKQIEVNPLSFKSYGGLSKIHLNNNDFTKAKTMASKSIEIAKQLKARQWQLNELKSNVAKIEQHIQTYIYESSTLKIKQLSKNTYIHISYLKTKSFGNVACNGMIFIDHDEAIVFDTPSYNEDALELIHWIEQKKKATIKAVVLNHFHIDCLGGLSEFHKKNIPSYAAHQTIELAKADDATVPQNGFDKVLELTIGKEKIINEHFGEAHTKDNITSYLPSENILFGGCQIKKLKAGKGNLNDANIKEWANTVRSIKEKYPNLKTVIPGHGKHGGIELLDYTIKMFDTSK